MKKIFIFYFILFVSIVSPLTSYVEATSVSVPNILSNVQKETNTSNSQEESKSTDQQSPSTSKTGSKEDHSPPSSSSSANKSQDNKSSTTPPPSNNIVSKQALQTLSLTGALVNEKWGDVPWTFDTNTGTLTFTGGGNLGEYASSPWNRGDGYKISATAIKKIIFTQPVVAPENSIYLFTSISSHLTSVTSIEGLDLLDTSKVTSMDAMFWGMNSLTSLDVSHFDTSSVTNMDAMFYGMSSLTTLDLSHFDTSKVTSMDAMFYGMNSLTSLDVSHFDTSSVTNMFYMFDGLRSLTSLDVSHFDMSHVTNMSYMFYEMNSLTSLDVSHFDTSSVTDMALMFDGLRSLSSLTLGTKSKFNSSVNLPDIPKGDGNTGNWIKKDEPTLNMGTSTQFMTNYDGTHPGTYVWDNPKNEQVWGDVPWAFDTNTGTLTFTGGGNLGEYASSPWNRGDSYKISPTAIKKIIFTQPVVAPKDSSFLFAGHSGYLSNVTSIERLDLLDTSNVTDMSNIFNGMSSLTTLDLSQFDTSNVTSYRAMFYRMNSIANLDVSHFDTSNGTDMDLMFYGLNSLSSLTLGPKSKFNSSVALPDIPKGDGNTGNWIKKDEPTLNMGTSTQFMTNYNGTHPGTYIWESGSAKITSISSLSFGTQPLAEKNTATTKGTINIEDTLAQRPNQGWKLTVSYDRSDAQTKQWMASNLELTFKPHSDQAFLKLPSTLTVNQENQLIAEMPDESKKGTQMNQTIELNPELQVSGKVLVGTYRAQLLWNMEAIPS